MAHSASNMRETCIMGSVMTVMAQLCPEWPGPKAFGGAVRNAYFLRCFRAPGNIVKYDGKTNPSVWLIPSEPSWTIC
jgi:hypothetical protein